MKLDFVKKIIKSKTFKKILCILAIFFVWYIVFSAGSTCFADDGGAITAQTKMENFNVIAAEIIKITYVLLWPLLFVCGIALDNSLVYGSWLHLDVPLWSLWNVMKNIANFALWFFVLFAILKNMVMGIGNSWDKKWTPFEVIKNTLIAGILIQMSRFLVAAIIDVSTILTYAVWGLPITVLKSNVQYSNKPIMSTHINVYSDSNWLDYNLYYTYWEHNIPNCLIKDNLSVSGVYIVWPDKPYVWDSIENEWFYTDFWYCAVWWWPYKYEHVTKEDGWIYPNLSDITFTWRAINDQYRQQLSIPNNWSQWSWGEWWWEWGDWEEGPSLDDAISSCRIIPVDSSKLSEDCSWYWALSLTWADPFFQWQDESKWLLFSIDNLIEQSKWYVWPLITIYSSLLDIQSFADFSPGESYVQEFISLVFKLIFSFVLIAPLVWLAVVLIVRIGVLWLVIAAAPILILIWVFFHDFLKWKGFFQAFDLWNLIKLVFAPVVITLAISLSLIFINAISGMNKDTVQREEVFNSLWIKQTEDRTYSILWLVDIQLDTTIISKWLDDIAYFITLLFATGIIRFFLVTALRMCGNTGKKVWDFIWRNVGEFLMSAPIVPLPWGRWNVSVSSLSKVPGLVTSKYTNKFQEISDKNMKTDFPWLYGESIWSLANQIARDIKSGELRSLNNMQIKRLEPIFGTADSAQLISMINGMEQRDIDAMTSNYDRYMDAENRKFIAGVSSKMPSTHTSTDAAELSKADLIMAVQYDDNLKNWARDMVWSAVYTKDWINIVDIIKWTESNPKYDILDREEYEKAHFGKKLEEIDKTTFDTRKSSNDPKYLEMDEYIKRLEREYQTQKSLIWRPTDWLSEEDKALQKHLKDFFTSELTNKLKELWYNFN